MPKFAFRYAVDTPLYLDFVAEADSEEEARKIAEQALDAGKFDACIDFSTTYPRCKRLRALTHPKAARKAPYPS